MLKQLFRRPPATLALNDRQPFVARPRETILQAALRAGYSVPYSCKVGGCGTCKCRVVQGRVREFTDSAYLLSKAELQAGVVLACQSAPQGAVVVEFPGWSAAAKSRPAQFMGRQWLSPDIAEVRLRIDQGFSYRAGQYARLRPAVPGVDIPARCYSFAAPAAVSQTELRFFVRQVEAGALSTWLLRQAQIGDSLELTAPLGDFYLRDDPAPLVAIAGGSGLAPILALLQQAVMDQARVLAQPATVLFGARTQADLYAMDELQAIARQWHAGMEIVPVLSEEPAESAWTGRRGWVTDALQATDQNYGQAYLCGPPPMIDAAIQRLQAAGLDPSHIYADKFSDQSGASAPVLATGTR